MTDHKDLVKRLLLFDAGRKSCGELHKHAAEAIEALVKERDEAARADQTLLGILGDELDIERSTNDELTKARDAALVRVAELEKERDEETRLKLIAQNVNLKLLDSLRNTESERDFARAKASKFEAALIDALTWLDKDIARKIRDDLSEEFPKE
jgi:hypothetical protein